eukprot:12792172-Alexandrium_andersonii.AAC.1
MRKGKSGGPGGPCFLCGGPHMKSQCPKNRDGAPAASSNFAFGFAGFDVDWGAGDTTDEDA